MRMMRFGVWRLGIAALLLGAPVAAQDIGLELGSVGPGAKVETLEGQPADLAQYIGKQPVLLEFWAAWCENCHQLEPKLKTLHTRYGERITFIAVAVSVNQSPARAKAYVAKNKLPWLHLYDRKGEASGAYDAPATSYIVILDRQGKVVYTGLGGKQDLEPAIKKALGDG